MWQRSKLKTVLVVQSERDIFSDNQGNHHIYNTHSTTEGFSNQAPPLNYLLYTGSYCSMIVVNGISRTLHDDRRTIKKRRAKAVEPRPKLLHRSIRLLLPGCRCCCCCCGCTAPNGFALPYGLAPNCPTGPVCAGAMRFCCGIPVNCELRKGLLPVALALMRFRPAPAELTKVPGAVCCAGNRRLPTLPNVS
jgi:hypothetical protein